MFNRNEASTAWKQALWHCTRTLPAVGVLPPSARVVLLAVVWMIQQDPVQSCSRSVAYLTAQQNPNGIKIFRTELLVIHGQNCPICPSVRALPQPLHPGQTDTACSMPDAWPAACRERQYTWAPNTGMETLRQHARGAQGSAQLRRWGAGNGWSPFPVP